MRNWLKTLLFISAFSPALLTLAYVRYDLHGWGQDVAQLLVIGIIGSAIPILIMKLLSRSSESISFDAKKIESNDFMLLMFVGSYLIPIIARASDLQFGMIVILTSVLILMLWLISSLPSHPLLWLLRYRFYKVESSAGVVYTFISKRDIRDPKSVKFVKKISETMLMEVNK
jgi:hypothetical protein